MLSPYGNVQCEDSDLTTKDSRSKQQSRNLIVYSKENGANTLYTNLLNRTLSLETSISSHQEY